MSDIIQDAKRLLDGATPGPWVISGEFDPECPELQGAPQLENGLLKVSIISHDIYGDFFPEDGDLIAKSWTNARALSGETWEYAVQFQNEDSGEWYTSGFYGIGMHGQKWFASREEAERQIERSYPAELVEPRRFRIVRRRVSPPEIIHE